MGKLLEKLSSMIAGVKTFATNSETMMPSGANKAEPGESTKKQTPKEWGFAITANDDTSQPPSEGDIKTYRLMRQDPTIALARAIANAPIRSAEWTVEGDDDAPEGSVDLVESMLKKTWRATIRDVVFSRDYGWQAFEIVYIADDGEVTIQKLKPLVPEITQVVIDEHGNYIGLVNGKSHASGAFSFSGQRDKGVYLPPGKSLWITNEQEGSDFYGESVMQRARKAWESYNAIRRKEDKYSSSVAGPIPYVIFPDMESEDENGQKRAAAAMAATLINSLQNAKGVAIPGIQSAFVETLVDAGIDPFKSNMWQVGFIEHKGNYGKEFLELQHARDVEKLRAWLVPERAATEGQNGTKAEAETHGNIVLTIADLFLDDFLDQYNEGVIDELIRLNYGEKAVGTVRVRVEKRDPKKQELLRTMVQALYGAPVNLDVFEDIANVKAIFEMIGLPVRDDIDDRLEDRDDETITLPIPAPVPKKEDEEEEEEPVELELDLAPQEGEIRKTEDDQYMRFTSGRWEALDADDEGSEA